MHLEGTEEEFTIASLLINPLEREIRDPHLLASIDSKFL